MNAVTSENDDDWFLSIKLCKAMRSQYQRKTEWKEWDREWQEWSTTQLRYNTLIFLFILLILNEYSSGVQVFFDIQTLAICSVYDCNALVQMTLLFKIYLKVYWLHLAFHRCLWAQRKASSGCGWGLHGAHHTGRLEAPGSRAAGSLRTGEQTDQPASE